MSANKIRRFNMKWGLLRRKDHQDDTVVNFRSNFDRMLEDFFNIQPSALFESSWMPKVDIEEKDDRYMVRADLPGMDLKDIDVKIEENHLVITGEKKSERRTENKKNNFIVSERHFGSFKRSIALPDGVKFEEARAMYKDGVLNLELPKDDMKKPEKIKIEVK